MDCNDCGFPLDSDSHIFNVNCAASNAENDQLMAEVREIEKISVVSGEELAEMVTNWREIQDDWQALMKFQGMLILDPSSYVPAGMTDA